jgi:hypothetical protein
MHGVRIYYYVDGSQEKKRFAIVYPDHELLLRQCRSGEGSDVDTADG